MRVLSRKTAQFNSHGRHPVEQSSIKKKSPEGAVQQQSDIREAPRGSSLDDDAAPAGLRCSFCDESHGLTPVAITFRLFEPQYGNATSTRIELWNSLPAFLLSLLNLSISFG